MNLHHGKNIPSSISKAIGKRDVFFDSQFYYVSEEVTSFLDREQVFISSRQIPNCLTLMRPGCKSVTYNKELLLEAGFPLEIKTDRGWEPVPPSSEPWTGRQGVSASQIQTLSAYMSSLVEENARFGQRVESSSSFESEYPTRDDINTPNSEFEVENPAYQPSHEDGDVRIRYEDPFVMFAALDYASRKGLRPPTVRVWLDSFTLNEPIPSRLLGPGWTGRSGKGLPFAKIASVDVKMHVLLNHTFWGNYLKTHASLECPEKAFCKRLLKTIKWFLEGKRDPRWEKNLESSLFLSSTSEQSKKVKRAGRFIEMLNTVNGVFLQKILAYPEIEWTWQEFDRFIVANISEAISEEFLDDVLSPYAMGAAVSYYAEVKKIRQAFKDHSSRREMESLIEELAGRSDLPARIFLPEYEMFSGERDTDRILMIQGVLSQTRGAGTPCSLLVLRTKLKFIQTVTKEPDPLTSEEVGVIKASMEQLFHEMPDEPFLGLHTKAGIRVTASACYEKTRAEGGTLEAINLLVFEGSLGRECMIRDLETGDEVRLAKQDELTPGEYIFWRSLEEVLAMDPGEVSKTYLVVVSEPGKGRAVTKGVACLKMVLDVINGICSYPVGLVFESSHSGMTKESHGWNFSKNCFKQEDILFQPKRVERKHVTSASYIETVVYEEAFVGSTDYETATDFKHHQIAKLTGNAWMKKCGIPALLRGIVLRSCFSRRIVEFEGRGIFARLGTHVKGNTRMVWLKRGILMGDPLTKTVLHIVNVLVRKIALDNVKRICFPHHSL